MGHWADKRLPELKQQLGIVGDEHDAKLLGYLRGAESAIELATGVEFSASSRHLSLDFGGLAFGPTLGLQTPTLEAGSECWPIADPVHPEFSHVLQAKRVPQSAGRAVPKTEALTVAAAVLAAVYRDGGLSKVPLMWFFQQASAQPVAELCRQLLDPARHVQVPIFEAAIDGWWVQIARRVWLVGRSVPDEPRFSEMLIRLGDGRGFAAGEAIVIVARTATRPSDWAFVARVWTLEGMLSTPLSWRMAARAVHTYGLPTVCLDRKSTPEEVVAQMLLAAYWYGYLEREETALIPSSLAAAFPRDVARVRSGTSQPGTEEAAALLFERLIHPGFDPTRGAGSIRRYVAHHAATLVRDHRSQQAEFHIWDKLGIEKRNYYKLLAKFATKGPDGRYQADDEVVAKISAHRKDHETRRAAIELLRSHGFSDAAARKRFQRHGLSEIATVRPRRPRGG
jgi:hypothetical protein